MRRADDIARRLRAIEDRARALLRAIRALRRRPREQRGGVPARMVAIGGRTQSVAAWCAERGLGRATVAMRVRAGATIEDAIMRPLRGRRTRRTP